MNQKTQKSWKKGVAFVRGLNIYKNSRITKAKMLELCKKIEDENIKILRIVKTDNIIFKKRGIHYAKVGSKLEKVLSKYFGKPIHVTTRSMKTIKCLR
jgi:uncharacterized protein (DUF1697 family)